ncbi:MAG: energy transducer TonB [Fibrobacter sp.]|nr:energy transducer TonB [Fibrobacter sp.]
MDNENRIIVVSSGARLVIDRSILKNVRGGFCNKLDLRFTLILLVSVFFHGVIVYLALSIKINPAEEIVIEKIPERFVKLIIDKPLPGKNVVEKPTLVGEGKAATEKKKAPVTGSAAAIAKRAEAKKQVEQKVANVENKVRTVGVLGMLTGVGSTAKGPAVVDVLGTMKDKGDKFKGLDEVLSNMSGLKKNQPIEILDRKLVKSKDISVSHKEEIDDLIAGVGEVKTYELAKKGDFVIQKPESIEGAASNDSKRDPQAINDVVTSHRASIKMSYEKYLKRDPNLKGKITLRITISASGAVSSVIIAVNTTGNKEFADEVVRKVKMWQFEPVTGGDVTVSYPFVFTPAT